MLRMGIQEVILLLLLAGAMVYLIRYLRKHYFSDKAGMEDQCGKCRTPQSAKDVSDVSKASGS
jgi:hypothetical protein